MDVILGDGVTLAGLRAKEETPGWLSGLNISFLISAQVMISRFVSSSPELSSALTSGACLVFSRSLSVCPYPVCAPSHSLKINMFKKKKDKGRPQWLSPVKPHQALSPLPRPFMQSANIL